jgi:hypothetical protein
MVLTDGEWITEEEYLRRIANDILRKGKTNMSNYAICKNCEFCFDQDGFCHCEDAPPTDFIKGKRYLYAANANGECRWFRAKEVSR